jgi:membrane-associated phospholipid phosphatase
MASRAAPPRAASATVWPALVAVVTVVVLGLLVANDLTDAVDAALIDLVRSEAVRAPLAPLRWITEAGSTWAVTAVAAALIVGLTLVGRLRLGALAALFISAASLGNTLLKQLVARTRPEALEPIVEERGFSFPSGHSALGMVAWGIVAIVVARSPLPRRAKTALLIGLGALVFLVGLSRVYLGVHFPSDVVAGWAAGAAVVLLFAAVTRSRWRAGVSPGESRAAGEAGAAGDRAGPRSDRPAQG